MAFNSQPMNMGPMTHAKEDHLPDPQRSYVQQSTTGLLPTTIPANFWMFSDGNSQLLSGGGDSLWRLPPANQDNALYRGQASGSVRFSNLAAPLTLLPGKPLGPSGSGGSMHDGHLNIYGGQNRAHGAAPDNSVS